MRKRILGAPLWLVVLAVVATLGAVAMDLALGMHDDIRLSLTGGALALVVILVMGALGKFPER